MHVVIFDDLCLPSSFQLSVLCVFFISFLDSVYRDTFEVTNTHKYKKNNKKRKIITREMWILLWVSSGQLVNSKQFSPPGFWIIWIVFALSLLHSTREIADKSTCSGKEIKVLLMAKICFTMNSISIFFPLGGGLIQMITLVEIFCDVKLFVVVVPE